MAIFANDANGAWVILGLLAMVATLLAATRRTPATAGAALPILAAANGRQPARRTGAGNGRAATRKANGNRKGNGKGNGNGKATRASNGQTTQAAPTRKGRRAPADTKPTPAVNAKSGTARLMPGGLRDQVLAYLADRPGEELSPNQVAKALDRSSGAVGNALETLAERGEVRKTSQAPRRFMVPTRGKATRANGNGPAARGTKGTGTANGIGVGKAAADTPAAKTAPARGTTRTAKGRAAKDRPATPAAPTAPAPGPANGNANGGNGKGAAKPATRTTKRATR